MSVQQPTYHSSIYQRFKKIESGQYREIIRFYEGCKDQIIELKFGEYFELQTLYTLALYEIGAYESFLSCVGQIIEESVINNIKYFHGRDIYQELLFKKANAHFQLFQYARATHILKELIKIAPDEKSYLHLLKRTLSNRKPQYVHNTRAASVFIFILTSIIIAVEILVVRNFWSEFVYLIEGVRNGLFVLGLVVLIGGDLLHYLQVNHSAEQFVQKTREQKRKRQKKNRKSVSV